MRIFFLFFITLSIAGPAHALSAFLSTGYGSAWTSEQTEYSTQQNKYDRVLRESKDDALLFVATDGKQGNTARLQKAMQLTRDRFSPGFSDRQAAEFIINNY